MSNGPIEFASDEPMDEKGPTEFGGGAGLIQYGEDERFVHVPDASEVLGMVVRGQAQYLVDPLTGLRSVDEGAPAVDWATGAVIDDAWLEDGKAGKPADAPPRTGDPRSAEL